MRFAAVFVLVVYAQAQEHPFFDVKKVIRGALDMVASVPTSTPQAILIDGGANRRQQPILSEEARKQLSRLFHFPADFMHRLAAQNGQELQFSASSANFWLDDFIDDLRPAQAKCGVNTPPQEEGGDELTLGQQFFALWHVSPEILSSYSYYQPLVLSADQLSQAPQIIQHGAQTYVAVPQSRLSMLSAYQLAQPIRYVQSANTAVSQSSKFGSLQNSAEVSVLVPTTERRVVFESEANLHTPVKSKTISNDYDTLAKAAENAQLNAAKHQMEAFSISSPMQVPAIVDTPINAIPMQKQYDLRDLEDREYYALQQKILEMNKQATEQEFKRKQINLQLLQQQLEQRIGATTTKEPSEPHVAESTSDERVDEDEHHPLKQIRISRVDITTKPVGPNNASFELSHILKFSQSAFAVYQTTLRNASLAYEERRVETLRKKMADDRKRFGARKLLLSSLKHKTSKADDHKQAVVFFSGTFSTSATFQLTRQHCLNIRSFARQFGILNIRKFATTNCVFIENYYPHLKCAQIEQYMNQCYELFDM
ncbi:unnamed protein product [Toxocara canis]|uniref:DUF4476 domain-containing protein n=1 Tax=Toxocara canis TaxID=6265 RepID=A0A183UFA3_TOXCA|nr:unnamed protein product [Toxocara canis]